MLKKIDAWMKIPINGTKAIGWLCNAEKILLLIFFIAGWVNLFNSHYFYGGVDFAISIIYMVMFKNHSKYWNRLKKSDRKYFRALECLKLEQAFLTAQQQVLKHSKKMHEENNIVDPNLN